jgi:type IV pilus assembly protein PilY1
MSVLKSDMVVVDSIRLRQECSTAGEASFRTIVSLSNGAAPVKPMMDTDGDGRVTSRDSRVNRQSLSTGVNYGGSLLVTLGGNKNKLVLCNTGVSGTIECNPLGSSSRVVSRVSWREIIAD